MRLEKELSKFRLIKVKRTDYRTTIDLEVQKFTTGLLEDKAAAVCVMDIYNGDIVSMVSSLIMTQTRLSMG